MNGPKDALSFLGSKTLTVWLAGMFIVYYLSVAVWSGEAFAALVDILSTNNYARFVYIIFIANLTSRIVHALKALWPRKTGFFLRLPLYSGLIIFLVSYFLSLNVRENSRFMVAEGNTVDIPWENTPYRVTSVDSALEKHALRAEDSAVFDYEPRVTLSDGSGVMHEIRAFPPKRIESTYMHILNFGIAPGIELRNDGEVLTSGYVPLRLTPYGKFDSFELKPFPYKFYVSILPTRIIKRGRETVREYDLLKPQYGVEVVKGDKLIVKEETDSSISFDGTMSLSFSPPTDWVLLEVAYDPFLPWLVAGLFLLLTGIMLYPFSFIGRRGEKTERSSL